MDLFRTILTFWAGSGIRTKSGLSDLSGLTECIAKLYVSDITMESKGKKRKLVDSLFMTPLHKKKKIQQLLIESQELDDDMRGKSKCASMTTSHQMEEISLKQIVKSGSVEFGEKKNQGSASSVPENMRDLELKEISIGDVTAVDNDHQLGCRGEESDDKSDNEGEEGDDVSEEGEDCSESSSDYSEGEDDCSDEEE